MTKHLLYRTLICSGFIAAALTAGAPAARAQGAAFGAPGSIAITGDFEGHLRNGWELRLHPSLDYFIAPNVSIGGVVGLQYRSGTPSATTLDLGVRAGYNLAITPVVSFWPQVGIYYSHTTISSTANSPSSSSSSTSLGVNAPFLYHIATHFFLGAGPFFNLPLDGGGNSYGLQTVVGGWF
jgi:outer membrane protein with beta-barrel domain